PPNIWSNPIAPLSTASRILVPPPNPAQIWLRPPALGCVLARSLSMQSRSLDRTRSPEVPNELVLAINGRLHFAGNRQRSLSLRLLRPLTLVLALPASAQKDKPLPKDLPPFGPEKPFQTPRVQQAKLENGLTVWLVSEPGFPKVSYNVVILGGYAADPKERPGLSDLLAATIDQGTASRNARQIAEQLQDAGGDLSASASRDAFSVSAGVLSSKSSEGLAILADVLQNATFPDSEVALAKRNLLD